MILGAVLILGFTYGIWPTLIHIICSLFWKTLCRLWADLQGVVQSAAVRRVVCQAVVGSFRTAGTILILPCIIIERLWPVPSSQQHRIDPPHPKDMHGSPHIPLGGEQPLVKCPCAGRAKNAACGRTKLLPVGQIYYCASHMDQCPKR